MWKSKFHGTFHAIDALVDFHTADDGSGSDATAWCHLCGFIASRHRRVLVRRFSAQVSQGRYEQSLARLEDRDVGSPSDLRWEPRRRGECVEGAVILDVRFAMLMVSELWRKAHTATDRRHFVRREAPGVVPKPAEAEHGHGVRRQQ